MTLYQIIRRLETFSLTLPNVRTASDGDVYAGLNDNPELKYGVFFVTQNTHQELEDMDRYGLTLFYIDRLDDTLEDNRLQIQSIGKEVLSVILRDFCEEYNIDFPTVNYTPFTQKFKDETAGVYAQITLDVIKGICADDFSDIISIYQTKTVNLTENGQFIVTPDESYTALEKVIINVDVECESYEQGFEDGFESGVTNQKNKLTSIYIDENGQYNRTDGFSSVTVNVPQSGGGDYQQGYEDGMEAQKALLSSITITTNGDYSYENGYSAITVNVPQSGGGDYQQGYEDGVEYQKSLLSSATFNQNGDYTLVNGWSAITIDVSGYTQEDLDNAYNQGYIDGIEDCKKTYLAVSETEISLSSSAQSKTIDVFSNTLWNVVDSPQWCTITPISGINDGSISITVSANTDFSREGTIILRTSDLTKTVQITLKQAGSYVPSDYALEPLTFEIVSGNTFSISAISSSDFIQYSKNKGEWTTFVSNTTVPVNAGDIVQIRGNNLTENGMNHHLDFDGGGSNCTYNVYGNIMSLVHPTDFSGLTTFSGSFSYIFLNNKKVISAENLVLPATTLSNLCYHSMFQDCSLTKAPSILPATTLSYHCYDQMFTNCQSLTTAPELPATTLADSCYYSMFNNCKSLNYIKCLATDISATRCTFDWVDNVAASGTFVKAAGMNDWPTGYNGIPNNWTIIDAS